MNKTTEQTEHPPEPGRDALTLNEAATLEGAAPDALRMRYRRGTLPGYRDAEGRIFIYRDALRTSQPNRPNATTEQQPSAYQSGDLVDELRRQLARMEAREADLLADLRAERERSGEAARRADTLILTAQKAAAMASEQAAQSLALLPAPGDRTDRTRQPSTTERPQAGQPMAVNLDTAGPTLSTAQAAQALGRSPRTLLQWASRENAPLRPLALPGGPHRWSTAEVSRLVNGDA